MELALGIQILGKSGTASGLNAGALSKINSEMVKALYKQADINRKEMEL